MTNPQRVSQNPSFDTGSSNRRDHFKYLAGAAIATSTLATQTKASQAIKKDRIRVGFVGLGLKGWQHVRNLLHVEGVELVAVCDVREEACSYAQKICRLLKQPEPKAYTRGERDYERMCQTEDLDLVYTATPWEWHVPICLAAMKSGKHAATEIPAAITVDECWQLVETSESTGKYLSMMENVNYRREELAILRMIREGLLGEMVYGEAGYMHDTRYLKIREYGDGLWLGAHHANRNGSLYPTHGIGPQAWYFNIDRGNRMEYLVSMSSAARGMNSFAKEHLPEGHPYRERDYINGDVNVCMIRLVNGESIVIKHDTDLPRPYSRRNVVQGTRGIVRGFPKFEISLEQRDLTEGIDNPNQENAYLGPHHRYAWRAGEEMYAEYDHPLWRSMWELAEKTPLSANGFDLKKELRSGDYIEDYRLIQALRQGTPPDFDVYDAASWSVIAPLSEQSVAKRSQAIDFPDFTRGKWKSRPPLNI
jgi:hypothetical protein